MPITDLPSDDIIRDELQFVQDARQHTQGIIYGLEQIGNLPSVKQKTTRFDEVAHETVLALKKLAEDSALSRNDIDNLVQLGFFLNVLDTHRGNLAEMGHPVDELERCLGIIQQSVRDMPESLRNILIIDAEDQMARSFSQGSLENLNNHRGLRKQSVELQRSIGEEGVRRSMQSTNWVQYLDEQTGEPKSRAATSPDYPR